jgi:cytochrome P450
MGAHLARIEVRTMIRQLARRLSTLESAGPPLRLQSSAVGGIKRLPIRYAAAH